MTPTPTKECAGNETNLEAGSLETEPRLPNDDKKAKIKDKYKKLAVGTFLIIHTVMLYVGITTAQDCPINPNIPIYVAVAGALGIASKLLPFINYKLQWTILEWIASLLYFVEFAWMIVGSVWIYTIYKPNYLPSEGPYCDKTAYLLAFWLLTINHILIGLVLAFAICVATLFCIIEI